MTGYFDKLGLSPQERRLVVIVGIVVFVVINWWVILPMFGEWGRFEQRIKDKRAERDKFNAEIARKNDYEIKLKTLEKQGSQVASEEAALRLQQEVVSQANLTGLGYGTITPVNRAASILKTNSFFDEASVNVSVNTGEKELIDFLVRLADKDLLIRAKSMDIGPDPTQMRLQGNLTLVKSFQRKPPPRSTASPAPTPAAKPAPGKPAGTAVPSGAPPTNAPVGVQPQPKAESRLPGPSRAVPAPSGPVAATNPAPISPRSLPKPLK